MPFENSHDAFDLLKFMIINVGIMCNSDERLMDILDKVNFL